MYYDMRMVVVHMECVLKRNLLLDTVCSKERMMIGFDDFGMSRAKRLQRQRRSGLLLVEDWWHTSVLVSVGRRCNCHMDPCAGRLGRHCGSEGGLRSSWFESM